MQTQENTGAEAGTASALERSIDIAVARAEVDRDARQRLRQIAKSVKMAGFRPGKVPLDMVAKQYGMQAQSDAVVAAVEKVFNDKAREQGLRVAGHPSLKPKDGESADVMEFTATFEIFPEIKLADVANTEIERPVLEVTDKEVDNTMLVLRKQRGTYEHVADRVAANGDRLTIDFVGRKNGEEFEGGKATDFPVVLGGGQMMPGFDESLVDMTEGQTKTFDVTFPADYPAADLAGQTVQFEATCKKVEELKLPELDEAFARGLGIKDGNLEQMRSEVRANLEREVKKRLHVRARNKVMDVLLAANEFEVPKAVVNAEAAQMAENAKRDLQARGLDPKNLPIEASMFVDQAVRRVKMSILLAELVAENSLQATPAQVRAVVDDYAQTFEDPKEVVTWYYKQPQRLAEAEAMAMEKNVVDWVLNHAKVVDKTIGFDELMGNAA